MRTTGLRATQTRSRELGRDGALVFFLFDLLFLDSEDLAPMPLARRKERLNLLP